MQVVDNNGYTATKRFDLPVVSLCQITTSTINKAKGSVLNTAISYNSYCIWPVSCSLYSGSMPPLTHVEGTCYLNSDGWAPLPGPKGAYTFTVRMVTGSSDVVYKEITINVT